LNQQRERDEKSGIWVVRHSDHSSTENKARPPCLIVEESNIEGKSGLLRQPIHNGVRLGSRFGLIGRRNAKNEPDFEIDVKSGKDGDCHPLFYHIE
jgi:hypothetical protein